MIVQYNTDKAINGSEEKQDYYRDLIKKKLKKYQSHISKIIVHVADENGPKNGNNDMRCLIEARVEGYQPIAASDHANSVEHAVVGAVHKLIASLDKIFENIKNHH